MAIDQLSTTFAAIADPTRRAILSRLSSGEIATVTELAKPFRMTMPAITKHLKVLERAGLIERSREGKCRPCRLQAAPFKNASAWIADMRAAYDARLDRMGDYLQELQAKEKKHGR